MDVFMNDFTDDSIDSLIDGFTCFNAIYELEGLLPMIKLSILKKFTSTIKLFKALDLKLLAPSVPLIVLIMMFLCSVPAFPFSLSDTIQSNVKSGSMPVLSSLNLPQSDKKVLLILVDRINLDDIQGTETPNIDYLIENGAIGLMNTNTAHLKNSESTHVTIGAGTRSHGNIHGALALNSDELFLNTTGNDVFYSRTGIRLPAGSVGIPNLKALLLANAPLNYEVAPGILGQSLNDAQLYTAVLGNSDTSGKLRRYGATIAMNAQGIVNFGDVSERALLKSPRRASEFTTYYERIFSELNRLWDQAHFFVIELGDISRLEENRDMVMDDVFYSQRENILKEVDRFVGRILNEINISSTLLIMTSPTPPTRALAQGNIFTPCIIMGPEAHGNILSSETTRRKGLLTNLDITAAILDYFAITIPSPVLGRPVYTQHTSSPLVLLNELTRQSVNTYKERPPVIQAYIGLQIIVLLTAIILIIWNGCKRNDLRQYIIYCLVFIGSIPLSLLFTAFITTEGLPPRFFLIFITGGILTILSIKLSRNTLDPFILLAFLTATSILADIHTGSNMQQASILGYCPVIAGRFYGIGNEYMGILVGAVLISSTAFVDRFNVLRKETSVKLCRRRKILALLAMAVFYGITIYSIGFPGLGANAGGAIVSTIALIFAFSHMIWQNGWRSKLAYLLLIAGIILGTLVVSDLLRPAHLQSHFARTVHLIQSRGPEVIREIVWRKLETNIKIFRYTIWSRALLLSLGILGVLFYKPPNYLKKVLSRYGSLSTGLIASLVASGATMAFNDSGVAPAATAMLFAMITILSLVLKEQCGKKGEHL